MRIKQSIFILTVAVSSLLGGPYTAAYAQVIPRLFGGGGAVAFEPEIGVVNTGVLNDVQATVSSNLKYVTINAQPQQSNLIALREFGFQQQTHFGFVGNSNLGKVPAGGQLGALNPPLVIGVGSGLVLNQLGMTRLVISQAR